MSYSHHLIIIWMLLTTYSTKFRSVIILMIICLHSLHLRIVPWITKAYFFTASILHDVYISLYKYQKHGHGSLIFNTIRDFCCIFCLYFGVFCWLFGVFLHQCNCVCHPLLMESSSVGMTLGCYFDSHDLTHWGRGKMDAISQTTFSSAFSWMKMFEFLFKFHWNLFLTVQLTIFQHWFR